MKLSEAMKWARDAEPGEYLVTYDEVYDTDDMSDDGSRCGFDDYELDAIGEVLGRRGLTLAADDEGLYARV